MLERNFLSHAKLALLLVLLASSVLLRARLPGPDRPKEHEDHPNYGFGIPLASIQVAAALVVIGAGYWEYESGMRDLHVRRGFLLSNDPHFALMFAVIVVVTVVAIVLLATEGEVG